MKILRRELLKNITLAIGALSLKPAAFARVEFAKSDFRNFRIPFRNKKLRSDETYTKDIVLPSNPKLYDVYSNINFEKDKNGNLPVVKSSTYLFMGQEKVFGPEENINYTFQFLGPDMGWIVC